MHCKQADELYKTVRFAGAQPGENQKLFDHAIVCPQTKWTHALATELWSIVQLRRGRRNWYARLLEDQAVAFEREFTGLSGVDA